jgi:hypothetical protein
VKKSWKKLPWPSSTPWSTQINGKMKRNEARLQLYNRERFYVNSNSRNDCFWHKWTRILIYSWYQNRYKQVHQRHKVLTSSVLSTLPDIARSFFGKGAVHKYMYSTYQIRNFGLVSPRLKKWWLLYKPNV